MKVRKVKSRDSQDSFPLTFYANVLKMHNMLKLSFTLNMNFSITNFLLMSCEKKNTCHKYKYIGAIPRGYFSKIKISRFSSCNNDENDKFTLR